MSSRLWCKAVESAEDWAVVIAMDEAAFAVDDHCNLAEYAEWQQQGLKAILLFLGPDEQAQPVGAVEWERDDGVYVASVVVLPPARRRGYATEALDAIMQRTKCSRAWCKILDDNAASRRVFAKLGFVATAAMLARGYRVHVREAGGGAVSPPLLAVSRAEPTEDCVTA